MGKYKKLVSNSITLTIGNFGSKFITFFLVPLYTAYLTTSEYGFVDIITTTVNLLIPVLTLETGQAIIRIAIAKNNEENHINLFSNIILYSSGVLILSAIIYPILNYFNIFDDYALQFILLLVFKVISNEFASFARGIGRIRVFSINGILNTFVTVVSNIIMLIYFDMGVDGYILSMILASFISCIYLFIAVDGYKLVRKFSANLLLLKEMITFSLPLVPNSIMWWLVNGATRYFILFFVGTAGNGLFAVANKIPTIVSTFQSIFSQAWQLSSFEEFESDDREEYFSNIFNIYVAGLFLSGSLLLVINKPIMSFFASESFFEGWKFVPFLMLGVVFQSLANFLGMIYTASRTTTKAFTTSVYAGITSLVSNAIFVPIFGTFGASFAIAVSFFVMFITRFFDTRKILKINVNYVQFFGSIIIYLMQTLTLFMFSNVMLYIIEIILFVILIFIHRQIITKILFSGVKMLKRLSRKK